jgi:translation initiation factor IF-1
MVNVYNEYGEVVAQVKYSENLDFWDGSNYTCGSTGRHKGLTRLKSGDYVLVHGTQWQGERDHAEIITAEEALQEILRSGNIELLEEKRFAELKELYEKTMLEEEDG